MKSLLFCLTLFSSALFAFAQNEPINADTAKIKGSGFAFSPKVQYKFEYDVANGQVLDAVIKWNFTGNWTVWFGQTKLPGNIERVFSSQKLQLVDRSLLNSRFTLDRDAGFQLRHHFKLGKSFLVR